MNERVRVIRKTKGLTLEKFGKQLGIKKNSLSQIENGKNNLTDQMIISICREFDVNEEWLRTGEGEMFRELSRDEQIADFIGEIQSDPEDTFKKKLVSTLAKMNEDEWNLLEAFVKRIMLEEKKED